MDYFNEQEIRNALVDLDNEMIINNLINLTNEEFFFPSFHRGLTALISRKNYNDLSTIESSFLYTIDQVKNLTKRGYKSWNEDKIAMYLYTLQYVILHLKKLKIPNMQNEYVPQLLDQLKTLDKKCKTLGIRPAVIQQQKLSVEYKLPENQDGITRFGLIDSKRINEFIKRLNVYEVTHKNEDLYEEAPQKLTQVNPNLKQQQVSHDQFEALFKKFVDQIKAQFHFPKLDLNTYNEHYIQINNEIRKILKENSVNLKLANIVINAFKKYLIEQENIPDFENNLV